MSEFKGTKGEWVLAKIDKPSVDNANTGYHTVTTDKKRPLGMIDVWFSDNHTAKTKEEALCNALLISKAPEILDFINRISGEMLRNDFVLCEK